jgi:cellulose synthase/poly-beta-1,6-N-acetylglucosamine synthase-like glycosyltransferase
MDWAELASNTFLVLYMTCLIVVCLYGAHRYGLIYLYWRHRRRYQRPKRRFAELPRVTIQLPMYNESQVARRIIEQTCRIDYPRERLDIQVLDDSTDGTPEICRQAVAEAKERGFDITYIHRVDRTGFKAGALANGLKTAKGEFVMIFDADFVPAPSTLQRTIHHFTDPKVAMVQTRWEHLNRDLSLLTRSQAILLDGHFGIEQTARNRSDRFITFNGTAGIWRIRAISESGGWQHDTLTEDLDLSYRAQMKGWRCVYLPNLTSPAELPPGMTSFKVQQFRWTKGGAQTAIKMLPRMMLSKQPFKVKFESFWHLTAFTIHLYMGLLMLMMFPAMIMRTNPLADGTFWKGAFDMSVLTLATLSGSIYYLAGQRETKRGWLSKLKYLPVLVALGVGLCVSNIKAVLEAMFGHQSEFVATPKFGNAEGDERQQLIQSKARRDWLPYVELLMGIYMVGCCVWAIVHNQAGLMALPFLIMFAFGFFWVSGMSFREQYAKRRARVRPEASAEMVTEEA